MRFARLWGAGSGSFQPTLFNVLAGPVALILLVLLALTVLRGPDPAFDFRFAYWHAGNRVLTGQSPYSWTPAQFRYGLAFVYPALSALVFAPLALLPVGLGSIAFTLVCIALVPFTLWLLGVRDLRVYGVSLIWVPVYDGWLTANESLFLMFGLACLWNWRDRPVVAGSLTAVMFSLKPMMWPLVLWLLVTRRWRASVTTLLSGLLLNVAAWSVIGVGQIGPFLHASRLDTALQWRKGYGFPALLGHLGAGSTVAIAAMLVFAALLAAGVLYKGLARRNEIQALTLAVALAVVASPVAWSHYLVLIVVPLALLRPRCDWVWVLPLLMWDCPPADTVHGWQAIVFWVSGATMFVALARQASPTLNLGHPRELAVS